MQVPKHFFFFFFLGISSCWGGTAGGVWDQLQLVLEDHYGCLKETRRHRSRADGEMSLLFAVCCSVLLLVPTGGSIREPDISAGEEVCVV